MSCKDGVSRRDALKLAGGVGLVGLAGCLGDGDQTDITVGSSSSGSTTYDNSQAIQRVVSEQSDSINFITQDAGGDPQSMRLYADDELNAYSTGNFILNQALTDSGPFEEPDNIDTFPLHGFSHLSLNLYWVALEDSGIETTDDLFGADIYALPAGWGLRDLTEQMYGEVGLWEELEEGVVNFETSEAASAMEEGRVDAAVVYTSNYDALPAWAVEVDARNDIQMVEMTDEFAEAANEFAGAGYEELDEAPGGWDQDVDIGADSYPTWTETYPYMFDPDISDEVVYDLMEICHEHYQSMQDAQPAILDYSDPENFTFALTHTDEVGVHPGAADWYEDNGVWNDDWTRGEI
nr:TAXI family TRAP transporter solute-binding subunit [Natrialba hulunbeirensis]